MNKITLRFGRNIFEKLFFTFLFFFAFQLSFGQVAIESQPFTGGSLPSGWTQTNVTFTTATGGYANFTQTTSVLTSPVYDLTGYTDVTLSFSVAKFGTGTDGPLTVQVSNDGGSTWTAQTFNSGTPTSATYVNSIDVPITVSDTDVRIRFIRTASQSQKRFRNYLLEGIVATPSGPEINVQGNSTNIVSGDVSPSIGDDTDFGAVNIASGSVVRTFTIQNTGSGALNISDAYLLDGTSGFTITQAPASTVSASSTTTIQVTFDPSTIGNKTDELVIESNDSDEGTYTFAIAGSGFASEPEINIQGNNVTIVDGDVTPSTADHTDFGSVNAASGSVVRTFTIQNIGTETLNISSASLVLGTEGFTITNAPASTVAASGSTTFVVTFDPASAGAFEDEVVIESDDADEATYTFAISGVGFVAAPEINVQGNSVSIVDGDTTPSVTDHTDFGSVTTSSGSIVRTFTIQNIGSGTLNLDATPVVMLDGTHFTVTAQPSSTTVAPAGSVTFQVTFDPSVDGLSTDTVLIGSDDADEAVYAFDISGFGIAPQPEINVTGNAVSIVSGDVTPATADHTDFGSVAATGSIVRTFTIQNTGDSPLVLGSPAVLLDETDGFSVTQQPTSPVGVGSSTTFQITFTPSVAGVDNNTVLIDSNDADEGTYSFAITGSGTIVAPVATAASGIGSSSFTANWNAVAGASSYEIDVYKIVTGSNATDLFISEYVEGSSNNKYIEIFNGTGVDVDLSDYRLRLYANGAASPNNDVLLSGTLANNSVKVYKNSSAGLTLPNGVTADNNTAVAFSGDDAVVLYKISTTSDVDIFGRVGNDPGTAWTGAGGYTTLDKTLRRNSSVVGGVTVNPTGTGASAFTTLTSEWALFNIDVVSGLGSHTFDGGSSVEYVLQNQNVGNVTSYEVTGLDTETAYFYVVRTVSGAVTSGNSNIEVAFTLPSAVTWNGTAWSNLAGPDANIDAIIAGEYNTIDDGGFTAKNLTIQSGSLTVGYNGVVTVAEGLFNELTAADVVVESNGVLMQDGAANLNTGAITVRRNSSAILRQDYTAWSSPVANQGLYAFSPTTLPNRFYVYNTGTDQYSNAVGFNLTGLQYPSPLVAPNGINGTDENNVPFAEAKGYLIRTPWNHPTAPANFEGEFSGVPNSGNITYTMSTAGSGFNLVGNPYPSPINMVTFVEDNATNITTSLYFWRETNGNTSNNAYCQWNDGVYLDNGQPTTVTDPNDVIRTGQGFFVEATGVGTDLLFTNDQRIADVNNQFFRENNTQNVYWLNLTNASGVFSQTAVSYKDYATNGIDRYDGKNVGEPTASLTSTVDGQEFGIQGKAAFVDTDVVPMSLKVETAGNYSIAIDHAIGVFNSGQTIYLKDNLLSSLHNLTQSAYNFTSEAGTFGTRFEVVYRDGALNVDTPVLTEKQVVIYKNQANDFVINTGNFEMSAVKVFDIRGRLLVERQAVNASQTTITAGSSNEVLLVQITTVDGAVVTKKVIR